MEPPPLTGGPDGPMAGARDDTRTSWRNFLNPELLQPTILAISATYIVYLVGALYQLTPNLPAESQFSYYVASLGLISGLLFYARFVSSAPSYVSFMELAYIAACSIVIAVYIMYWFIPPNFSKLDPMPTSQPPKGINGPRMYDDSSDDANVQVGDDYMLSLRAKDKLDTSYCIDAKKCSHPVHLVLQSAFMVCIVLSLVFSIIRRG